MADINDYTTGAEIVASARNALKEGHEVAMFLRGREQAIFLKTVAAGHGAFLVEDATGDYQEIAYSAVERIRYSKAALNAGSLAGRYNPVP